LGVHYATLLGNVLCRERGSGKEVGMSVTSNAEREQQLNQVLDATNLSEIAPARQSLRDWLQHHPEDVGMRDGFEQLAMMQEIAETAADDDTTAGERKAA
jgi:hypothetical protein